MFTYILYGLAGGGLILSFIKDRQKTKKSLIKAWKAFENIMPQFLAVLVVIGLALAILSPETITKLLGNESGVWGLLFTAILGAVTLIPAFVAFPLAAALLHSGAGYMQIAAFISSLTMVGIITLPLEIKTFGKKATLLRNTFAFVFSIISALIIGVVFK